MFTNLIHYILYLKTIEFLDHLHALLDNIMDEFDVYKVETVNNTCLIASGELASLEIMMSVMRVPIDFLCLMQQTSPLAHKAGSWGNRNGNCHSPNGTFWFQTCILMILNLPNYGSTCFRSTQAQR